MKTSRTPERLCEVSVQAEAPVTPEKGRRPDIEKELEDKYHVKFKFHPAMPLKDFDKAKSLHNQARFEALSESTVAEYAEAIRRGDDFPAVLAYRPTARSRLVMVDGNHRFSGHESAGRESIAVYELHRDTDKRTIALLTFSMNTRHGRPTSEAERVEQAIYLIEAGASTDAAAAAVNLSPRVLRKAIAARRADQRADEVGLKRPEWEALHSTSKNRLLNVNTDEGFRAAAELAYKAKLDANEVFELVQLLNATRSSTKQQAIIKQWHDVHQGRIQAAAGGVLGTANRRAMTPKGRVASVLGQVLALPEADDAIVKGYAEPERKEASQNLRKASERLAHLADLLDPKRKR